MTDRRRPAAAARVLAAGGSLATTLALIAAMGSPSPTPSTVPDTALRVVITDPRIDRSAAVAAAVEGARAGESTVRVPVASAAVPGPRGGSRVAHTATRSS
jgi:hypothetical protein